MFYSVKCKIERKSAFFVAFTERTKIVRTPSLTYTTTMNCSTHYYYQYNVKTDVTNISTRIILIVGWSLTVKKRTKSTQNSMLNYSHIHSIKKNNADRWANFQQKLLVHTP